MRQCETRCVAVGPPVKDIYHEVIETLRAVGIEAIYGLD